MDDAGVSNSIGIAGVVHEINSRKITKRLKRKDLDRPSYVNNASLSNSETPMVSSRASFRSRQTSIITGCKKSELAYRIVVDETTDKTPKSAEGQRVGFSIGKDQLQLSASKPISTTSGIGGTVRKTAWQTDGRKKKIKDTKPIISKTNVLIEEDYCWDSAESSWFYSRILKTFQVGPHPE